VRVFFRIILFAIFIGMMGVRQIEAGKAFLRTGGHNLQQSSSNPSVSLDEPQLDFAENSKFQDSFSPAMPFLIAQSVSSPVSDQSRETEGAKSVISVSVVPASVSVSPQVSGSFEVTIESGVTPIGAFDIDLSWTPGVFTIDSVAAGSSSEFGRPIANINNINGKLTITGFQFSSLIHPFGTFSVATINYTSGTSGSTMIDLSVQELSDTNGGVLTTNSIDGIFEVISGEMPTLTPTESSTATFTSTFIETNAPSDSPTVTHTLSASETNSSAETNTPTETWTAIATYSASPSPTQPATPTSTHQSIPTAVNSEADLDGDGKIGPGDLLLLLTDWGRPISNN